MTTLTTGDIETTGTQAPITPTIILTTIQTTIQTTSTITTSIKKITTPIVQIIVEGVGAEITITLQGLSSVDHMEIHGTQVFSLCL